MSNIPSRAVILAAGLGSRLRPHTDHRPKPLVPVLGKPILQNALEALTLAGVKEAAIVVGYRKEAIERACGLSFKGVEVTYVESSVFERTGSAYSLWLARDVLLQGDSLILEGDVFFEPEVLTRLLAAPTTDAAAVARFDATMTGSAVTVSAAGLVGEVRLNQTPSASIAGRLFKTMNIMRLGARTLRTALVPALERAVRSGNERAYVEQILAGLIGEGDLMLQAVDCGDLRWFEIDSDEDLRTAERIFMPAGQAADRRPAAALGL